MTSVSPVAEAPVLTVSNLTKRFGDQTVVDGVSFQVRRGECFGLLGPNGAGKSTTLKGVLGLIDIDGGQIDLLGHPVPAEARLARQRVGVVPQTDSLDPDFTVAENLLVYGRYFGLRDRLIRPRIAELLDFVQLGNRADARITELSGGMKRRLVIARALLNDPEIVFLDEPTTGLDPQARHLVWDRLKLLLARGKTIVLTTHFMDEAERLCDRLAIIEKGRKITEDSPERLIAREVEPHVIEVHGADLASWYREPGAAGVARRERIGETAFVYCTDPAATLADLADRPRLRYLHRPANLEDVFLKLTGRELRE